MKSNHWLVLGIGAVIIAGAVIFLSLGKDLPAQNIGLSSLKAPQPEQNQTQLAIEKKESQGDNTKTMEKPQMQIDKNKTYIVTLKTTEGDIAIQLSGNVPITANNFYYLAKNNFYDNTIFHRVIKGFMIQGGDPTGTGSGGPGYKFDDEPFTGEYTRGTVAMANAGPNTNGSQFFIMHKDYNLPKNYVIFGKVIEGMDVVDKIATAPTKPEGEASTPVNPAKINSVEISEE